MTYHAVTHARTGPLARSFFVGLNQLEHSAWCDVTQASHDYMCTASRNVSYLDVEIFSEGGVVDSGMVHDA